MSQMSHSLPAKVWKEGHWYVSQSLEVNVASQGETEEEALANLKEALELYFEDLPESATIPKISEVTVGELAIA